MGAPLLGPDGQVLIGVDPNAYGASPIHDPQSPSAVASVFQQLEDTRQGAAGPVQPAPQAPAPAVPQPVAAAPVVPDPLAPQAEPAQQEETGYSTEDLRALFEGNISADDMLGAVTHTVGEQEFTLAEAVDGFLAQPDAAIVAQQRGSLESEFVHRDGQRQELFDTAMEHLASQTNAIRVELSADQDHAAMAQLLATDPEGYRQRMVASEARKGMLANAEAELQRGKDHKARQRAEDADRKADRENRLLIAAIPEWHDPVKGPVIKQAIEGYARSIGYTPKELNGLTDSKQIIALRDGALGRNVQTKGKAVLRAARAAKLPAPSGRPHARGEIQSQAEVSNKSRADAFNQLRNDGSLDSAAAVFEGMK
jgi:hypothetical protein